MSPSTGQLTATDAEYLVVLVRDDSSEFAQQINDSLSLCQVTDELYSAVETHSLAQRWLNWDHLGGDSTRGGVLFSGGLFVPGPKTEKPASPAKALSQALRAMCTQRESDVSQVLTQAQRLLATADITDINLSIAVTAIVLSQ